MAETSVYTDDECEYNGESFEDESSDEDNIPEVGTDCSSGSHSESESELQGFISKPNETLEMRLNTKSQAVGFNRKRYESYYSSSSEDDEEVVVSETVVDLNNLTIPMEDPQSSDRTLVSDGKRETELNMANSANRQFDKSAFEVENEISKQLKNKDNLVEPEYVKKTQYGSQRQLLLSANMVDSQLFIDQEKKLQFPSTVQSSGDFELNQRSKKELSEKPTTNSENYDLSSDRSSVVEDKTKVCDTIMSNIAKILFEQAGMSQLTPDDIVQKIQNQPEMIKLFQSLDTKVIERLSSDNGILPPITTKTQESHTNVIHQNVDTEKKKGPEERSGDTRRYLKPSSNEHRKYMKPTQIDLGNYEVGEESEVKDLDEVGTDVELSDERTLDFDITSHTPTSFNTDDYALHVDILRRPSTSTSTEKMRSTPNNYKNWGRKSFSFTNAQVREIERQNNILLKKVISIKPTIPKNNVNPAKFVDQPPSTRTTTAAVNRKKQQHQIEKDNNKLRRKLQAIGTRRRVF